MSAIEFSLSFGLGGLAIISGWLGVLAIAVLALWLGRDLGSLTEAALRGGDDGNVVGIGLGCWVLLDKSHFEDVKI